MARGRIRMQVQLQVQCAGCRLQLVHLQVQQARCGASGAVQTRAHVTTRHRGMTGVGPLGFPLGHFGFLAA